MVWKIPLPLKSPRETRVVGNYPGRKIEETKTWKPDDYKLDGMAMDAFFPLLM
jgi:hypothetical protein